MSKVSSLSSVSRDIAKELTAYVSFSYQDIQEKIAADVTALSVGSIACNRDESAVMEMKVFCTALEKLCDHLGAHRVIEYLKCVDINSHLHYGVATLLALCASRIIDSSVSTVETNYGLTVTIDMIKSPKCMSEYGGCLQVILCTIGLKESTFNKLMPLMEKHTTHLELADIVTRTDSKGRNVLHQVLVTSLGVSEFCVAFCKWVIYKSHKVLLQRDCFDCYPTDYDQDTSLILGR